MSGTYYPGGQSRAGWHRIESYATCRRKGAAGKRFATTGMYLCRGTLIHSAMQHWYLRMRAEQRGENKNEIMEPEAAMRESARLEIERARTAADREEWEDALDFVIKASFVASYANEYKNRIREWEILEAEREYAIMVQDPVRGGEYLFTQRADLTVRDRKSRRIFIIDHKGTGRIGPETINKYTLSGQRAGYYLHGYNTYGKDFGGVIFSFIEYPPTPRAGEAPSVSKWKYHEPHMLDAPGAIEDIKKTIIEVERWLLDFARDNGGALPADIMEYPPLLAPGAPCYSTYGKCVLFDACRTGDIRLV